MIRWCMIGLAVCAVLFVVNWARVMIDSQADQPALVVEAVDRDLGQAPLGVSELAYRITNRSDREVRIVGLAEN